MQALTSEERRGALLVVALLLIGAAYDAWQAHVPRTRPVRDFARAPAVAGVRPDSTAAAAPEARVSPVNAPADYGGMPPVDLNHASAAQLDGLPGIGPVLARRIVEHRERHGRFRRVDELRAIRGVGPRLLERLRPRVRISS